MMLAQIMTLALRQLDEDIADINEYDDLFRVYANQGYQIALRQYYKPRETMTLNTDARGEACIEGLDIVRIVVLRDGHGREVPFDLSGDGYGIRTMRRNEKLTALCEVTQRELEAATDEPRLPEYAHPALADYICYRHLSSGNLAKQSRAQFFQQRFYQQMQMIMPQGGGSVTHMKNLYAATSIRNTRR